MELGNYGIGGNEVKLEASEGGCLSTRFSGR